LGRFFPASAPAPVDAVDADLAERAAGGDNTAFEELYRRHAQAAWRVAYAVTTNREDAADAVSDAFTRVLQALPAGRLREGGSFRAYLLTATRRAGIDQLRRRGRHQEGDVATLADQSADALAVATPTDRLLDAADGALVAAAFRGLPERWRSVLWLTEVEQIPAKEAAPLLGLSPNGVAQLAVRARNGLRERYLQAHLREGEVPTACRFTVEHLGAYVAGALSPRDLAKVDQHLAGCEPCRARHAELEELGGRLRRIVVPLPLGLGALALKKWRFHGGLSAVGKVRKTAALAGKAERPLAVMSATLFAAGLAGVGIVGGGRGMPIDGPGSNLAAPPVNAQTVVPSVALPSLTAIGADQSTALPGRAENLFTERRRGAADQAPVFFDDVIVQDAAPAPAPAPPPPADTNDPGPVVGPTPPAPKPAAQVRISLSAGGTGASAAAGQGSNSCTGGTVASQSAGCTPPPPNSDHILTASTGGTQLPAHEIGLP
jgi:RNA polymerase sigma factor (sigma-70 family)